MTGTRAASSAVPAAEAAAAGCCCCECAGRTPLGAVPTAAAATVSGGSRAAWSARHDQATAANSWLALWHVLQRPSVATPRVQSLGCPHSSQYHRSVAENGASGSSPTATYSCAADARASVASSTRRSSQAAMRSSSKIRPSGGGKLAVASLAVAGAAAQVADPAELGIDPVGPGVATVEGPAAGLPSLVRAEPAQSLWWSY
jgi:hypothetical protein